MPKNAEPLPQDQQMIIYTWSNEGAIASTVSVLSESPKESPSFDVYPNPFNNKINISFMVHQSELQKVIIFDILGKRIKTMPRKYQINAMQSFIWDGTDEFDRPVSGGLYLIGIKSSNRIERLEKVLALIVRFFVISSSENGTGNVITLDFFFILFYCFSEF